MTDQAGAAGSQADSERPTLAVRVYVDGWKNSPVPHEVTTVVTATREDGVFTTELVRFNNYFETDYPCKTKCWNRSGIGVPAPCHLCVSGRHEA